MCEFTGFALGEIPGGAEGQMEMLTGKLGADAVVKDMTELGKKILRTEREFNTGAGMTSADDRLPEFYYKEPLPPHNIKFLVTDEDMDSFFDF